MQAKVALRVPTEGRPMEYPQVSMKSLPCPGLLEGGKGVIN